MYAILLLGLICVGLAAGLAARAMSLHRVGATQPLRTIDMYGYQGESRPEAAEPSRLNLNAVAERVGGLMLSRYSRIDPVVIRRDLLGAGLYTTTVEAYLGYRLLGTATMTLVIGLLAAGAPSALSIMGVVVAAALAWRMPMVVVQRRAAERYEEINADLPELIDLLVVSVEAGVGLGGALQMIGQRMPGPLGDELRLMLQEQRMGLANDQSLDKLLERCDTPAVRSFVRSLQQGERLGVSIGQILRGLAIEMRTRRRQTAEEKAQKAPIKILFPLVFLIFPALFIVLLGPAVFAYKDTFGG